MSINLENLSDDLKNKMTNYNNLRKTLELYAQQKFEFERGIRENELAIEELEKIESDTIVYKSIGGILVKSERDRLLDEKKSQKAAFELKLKTIDQRQERVAKQIETLGASIEKDLKDQGVNLQ